ncbi:MAG: adenylate/guanylate cyclase domain-containing protein [Candidatus Acidiferrales bacterium]
MRILSSYHGAQRVWETADKEFVFGRTEEKVAMMFDLSPDQKVSRLHGRIWEEDGHYWVEDLNSSRGTRLNGIEIKGAGKRPLRVGDSILAGETTLQVESLEPRNIATQTSYLEQGTALLASGRHAEAEVAINRDMDATVFIAAPIEGAGEETSRRLKLLYDLPMQFAAKTQLDSLLPTVVDRLVEMLPRAESWALVLHEPATDSLLLKAFHAAGQPSLSETLARRAMRYRIAFIWKRDAGGDVTGSIVHDCIETGIYAPLLWQGEALGVICADTRRLDVTFADDDLRLMVAVAQYAAMAVAGHQLQERLRRETVARANLSRQFSPKVAESLLAHRGRLRLGGERSEATILCSDLRGFTVMSQDMDPDDVVESLNEYFAVLVPVIFANEGTIDKYMGDAILAIFGSPEPDASQHEHAVHAGLEMQAAVAKLNVARQARGAPTREIGIGIHCGDVVHGFIGTADRMEFTVISDAVNRASRYCAGAAGGEVLISPEVHERVWRIVETERTTIETKHEGEFLAYRVKCLKADAGRRVKGSGTGH